jgi:hypothetical protein
MAKARIDGTVDVELLPSEATIRWGENQLSIEYGGEVSIVQLHESGRVLDNTAEIAPLHSSAMMDLAIGMYEQAGIAQDEI